MVTNDSYTTNKDATLVVNAAQGVLNNDTDPDGDSLVSALVQGPANGTVTVNPDGSLTYVPNANFSGIDTFTYAVTDVRYSIVALGTLGGNNSFALDVSDNRQVTGNSSITSGASNPLQAYLWQNDTMTGLGVLPGTGSNNFSRGYAVNDAGVVVGESDNNVSKAFVYQNGTMTGLTRLAGDNTNGVAHDVNNANVIVGISSNGTASRPTIWTFNGSTYVPADLGTIAGTSTSTGRAWTINDAGVAAGLSQNAGGTSQATLWSNGTITNLTSLGDGTRFSQAFGVNENGQVVGSSSTGQTVGQLIGTTSTTSITRAFSWQNGTISELLPYNFFAAGNTGATTNYHSVANDVNDAGIVVGNSQRTSGSAAAATLWDNGAVMDLNALIPAGSGWTLLSAEGINAGGDIVGFGSFGGFSRAFLLVPEVVSLDGGLFTQTATVTIAVDVPAISDVADQATDEDTPTGAIAFTVGDGGTAPGDLVVTATSSNTALVPNASIVLGGSGADRTVTLSPAADQSGTTTITLTVSDAGGLTTTDTFVLTVNAVNDAPVAGNVTLPSIQVNSGATVITAAQLLANTTDSDSATLTVTSLSIANGLGALVDDGDSTWTYTPTINDDTQVDFVFAVSDGQASSNGQAKLDITSAQAAPEIGSPGDDTFTAVTGNASYHGLGGTDTINFGFKLTDAKVTYSGSDIIIDGPTSRTVLNGIERFVFTDGTVNNADDNWLVDDLFYYAQNHDVWNAHVDADVHFDVAGWKEGRDPDAFFDTSIYLAANPDVAATGVNPLTHYATNGWKEGYIPSLAFDGRAYLDSNPDVKAANIDPLFHFLAVGASEGRKPIAPFALTTGNGFDFAYYLASNPDVAAAGVDPFWHFQTTGWTEGRNPNAWFDTVGYLTAYADVASAHINPLDHYNIWGWQEGRDPALGFDTASYLAANPDVAAAEVNPLVHFLRHGHYEGRSAIADGMWG